MSGRWRKVVRRWGLVAGVPGGHVWCLGQQVGRPCAGDHRGPLRAEGSPAPGPGEVPPELGGLPLRVAQEPGSAGAGLEAGALGAGWAQGWVASLVLGLSGSLCSQESAWSLVSQELVTSRVGEKLGVMGKPFGSLRPQESRGAGIHGSLGVPWRPGTPELAGLLELAGRAARAPVGWVRGGGKSGPWKPAWVGLTHSLSPPATGRVSLSLWTVQAYGQGRGEGAA